MNPLEIIPVIKQRRPILEVVNDGIVVGISVLLASGITAARIRQAVRGDDRLASKVDDLFLFAVSAFAFLFFLATLQLATMLVVEKARLRFSLPGAALLFAALFLWYFGMTCLLFACNTWLFESVIHFFIGSMIGGLGLKALPQGSTIFAMGKRLMLRTADELMSSDFRSPILYLRSFNDDEEPTEDELSRDYDTGQIFRIDFYTNQRVRNFEEVLCDGLGTAAPVVAIERPGDYLPPLGAARKSVENDSTTNDEQWKVEIDKLLRKCRFIALIVGPTEGLKWEYQRTLSAGYAFKLLLVLPARSARLQIWRDFVRTIPQSDHSPLPEELPHDALAIGFRKNGIPVVFTGERESSSFRQIGEWACQNSDVSKWISERQESQRSEAMNLRKEGKLTEAMSILAREVNRCRSLRDNQGLADALYYQAQILVDQKIQVKGLALLYESQKLFQKLGDQAGTANVMLARADLLATTFGVNPRSEAHRDALALANEALKLFHGLLVPHDVMRAETLIARICRRTAE